MAVRIKRSVQAQFSTEASYVTASAQEQAAKGIEADSATSDPMVAAEARSQNATAQRTAPSFVSASALSKPAQDARNAEQVGGDDDDLL